MIARRVASQPIMAGKLHGAAENPERMAGSLVKSRDVPPFLQRKADQSNLEMIEIHPALDSIEHPNSVQTKWNWLYTTVANLEVAGEAYWISGIVNKDGEQRLESWAVPSHWIEPNHLKGPYTGFEFKPPGAAKGTVIPPENVMRMYFDNPSDPLSPYSPLRSILVPSKVDNSILRTQEEQFDRGINPNLIITVGKTRGRDGKLTDRRPRLSGHHRTQLIRSIREIWGNTVNSGDPAIIDGMIESVHKLQTTPMEMDYTGSGDTLKSRIFQNYHVNPIVAGQVEGANRASSFIAQRHLADYAVNPVIESISNAMTTHFGPMWEKPDRLLLWVQPYQPIDQESKDKNWDIASARGMIEEAEFRHEQLGLPPREGKVARNPLLSTVGGMTGAIAVLESVANGLMQGEQAVAQLMLFLEIEEDIARSLVGDGKVVAPPEEAPKPPAEEQEPPKVDEEAVARLVEKQAEAFLSSYSQRIEGVLDAFAVDHEKRLVRTQDQLEKHAETIQGDKLQTFQYMLTKLEDTIRHQGVEDENGLRTEEQYMAIARSVEGLRNGIMRGADDPKDVARFMPELIVPKKPEPQITVQIDSIQLEPIINVAPAEIGFAPEITVDVPQTNVTVQSLQGEKGETGTPGQKGSDGSDGAKGDKGEAGLAGRDGKPSKVTVELPEPKPRTAIVQHGDGSNSIVTIDNAKGKTPKGK